MTTDRVTANYTYVASVDISGLVGTVMVMVMVMATER
jgi:hypothetical protein